MEAPLFFRRPELTPPLSLPDERRLADAGQLNNLRVGMVLKQSHCMVKLQDRQRYLCRHHHRHARRSYCAAALSSGQDVSAAHSRFAGAGETPPSFGLNPSGCRSAKPLTDLLMIGEQPKTMKRHPAADNKSEPDGVICYFTKSMAEQTLSREVILVAQHHFHHGFVFIVRVIRHTDNTQLARIEINGHGILSLLSPVLPVNRPYILYFITGFQHEVKKLKSHKTITL